VRRGDGAKRRVALTFGTFFRIGERAAQPPDTVWRLAAEGHEVASRGWSHWRLWLGGPRRTAREIERAQELLSGLSGSEPRHFRPPRGMLYAAMLIALRRRRARGVLWSVQPEGLRPIPADLHVRHVLRRSQPGAIVDLHDAEGTPGAPARLLDALAPMINGLRAAGYEVVTVTELLR